MQALFLFTAFMKIFSYTPLCFPPVQAILENSKSINFGKHPAGKSPVIQGRLLLLLLVLLSTMLQMLSKMGCLLGVWFEVPVPGGIFLRSCLGLWYDPSGTFLAEKKQTHFTDNWSHNALKNCSYFYHAKAKWGFLHVTLTTSLESYGCYDFVFFTETAAFRNMNPPTHEVACRIKLYVCTAFHILHSSPSF